MNNGKTLHYEVILIPAAFYHIPVHLYYNEYLHLFQLRVVFYGNRNQQHSYQKGAAVKTLVHPTVYSAMHPIGSFLIQLISCEAS